VLNVFYGSLTRVLSCKATIGDVSRKLRDLMNFALGVVISVNTTRELWKPIKF
jgi:hypothetical protein